uniref:Uncharacterized protein n=1 Tax=Oryza punctata TaxID=4537 RepID=A0A0E0ML19_ORYPU
MFGDLIPREYGSLLARQPDGWAKRIFSDELPTWVNPVKIFVIDDDGKPSIKRRRAIAKGASTSRSKARKSTKCTGPSSVDSGGENEEDEDGASEDGVDDEAEDCDNSACPEANEAELSRASHAKKPTNIIIKGGVKLITAGIVLSVLREYRCEHITNFPQMLKDPVPENVGGIKTELKAFRCQY